MRVAVISDVHGNIFALESVLEDIKGRNIEEIVCTGDLVGYGPYPNEVIAKIQEEGIKTIQGNYDDAIGNRRIACGCDYKTERSQKIGMSSMNYTAMETTEENKEFLANLPFSLTLEIEDKTALFVHGSPRKINEYLYEDSEAVKEVAEEIEEDILVCGHTHLPYHRIIKGKHMMNVGSIGKPKHGNPNAIYTIIEVIDGKVKTEFIEVIYPVAKLTAALKETDLAEELVEVFEKGNS
ncbi:YfcE family phosphodiesterase [Orenia metallireducens]|jgi:putative phosphoesterase|uniref:Phosphoesterase n=1 Tax=Orenia metallireducens TaxID=1413210 RepID=A0A1C0A9B9_9FIRM|nr:metallophosphoesterase family protein [Orenia metallireducens]OCL26872.1 YfcE family phosphodiesterase [Orenia metallireducens]